MNFTREPIIETIITPRDGCKLVVRSSKVENQEDYAVDAVEVVSFGNALFFRSQERPKSFLVPVSDYEILEQKETRMVLKNTMSDKSIKISGGKDSPPRREPIEPRSDGPQDEVLTDSRPAPERMNDRPGKRDRRRRGRRGRDRNPEQRDARADHRDAPLESEDQEPPALNAGAEEEVQKAPSFISKLFPPPPTLIKETLSRYKSVEESTTYEGAPPVEETMFEHPDAAGPQVEDDNEE